MTISLAKVLPFFFDKIVEKVSEAASHPIESGQTQIQNILPINTFMAKEWRRLGFDDGFRDGTNDFFLAQKNAIFEGFHTSVVDSIYQLYKMRTKEEVIVMESGELEQRNKERSLANIRYLRALTFRYLSYKKIRVDDPMTEFAKCFAEYKLGFIAGRHDDSKRRSLYTQNDVTIFQN